MELALETAQRIEPCHLEQLDPRLVDVIADLTAATERLGLRLHPRTAADLADFVRVMNCYFSNLIEGHNTRPRDIQRALASHLEANTERRNLQLEALAHIRVQREIDRMYAEGRLPEPTSVEFIRWIHREFYRAAPETMLEIEGAGRRFRMVPGEFRSLPEHDVAVGRHLPPSSARVEELMRHFEQRYRLEPMGRALRIVTLASAHHRLNYVHPFPDGNGRVSRLMSHAIGLVAGIGAQGLWSISRGLARGLEDRGEYKRMTDYADSPRMGDLDGRGNLSLRALGEFVLWFLRVALDQVTFMSGLFELGALAERLRTYALVHRRLRPEAADILDEVLRRGELPRGAASRITRLGERAARDVLGRLLDEGLLASATPKGPVALRFPLEARDFLSPRLFPAEA